VKKAQAVLDKMLAKMVDRIIDAFGGIFKAIGKIWGNGIKGHLLETKKWFAALIKMTVAWGQDMAIDGDSSLFGSVFQFTMRDLLFPFVTEFVEMYTMFLRDVVQATISWGQSMAMDGESSLFGSVFVTILDMFKDMVLAFTDALPVFLDMWGNLIDAILQKFTAKAPAFFNAGANLIDALASGMLSRAQSLYNTASRIADGVTDAVEGAYEQTSPSKVFIRVGENLMQGWKIGIEKEELGLLSSMTTVASNLMSAASVQAQPALARAGSQRPVQAPAPVSNASVITNANVDMGGQVINNGVDQVMLQILIENALRNVL
jgi:hypothetical protein